MLPSSVPKKPMALRAGRRVLNIQGFLLCIFLPWLVFTVLFYIMSFEVRYDYPNYAWALAGVGVLLVIWAWRARKLQRDAQRDILWSTYMFWGLFVSVIAAVVLGDVNFFYSMNPYYAAQTLNTYPNVDPSEQSATQMMDAGRLYFAPGSHVDTTKAMGFKNLDIYCVAPIVKGEVKPETYDFWAAGINCCAGHSPEFHCGEVSSRGTRSGLRVMQQEQLPFFKLAVQQAESAYHIKALHPLFVYWLQDPVHAIYAFQREGYKYFILASLTHFVINLVLVIMTAVFFVRVRHQ
mmetsp:Transcript_29668/g.71299  ORF Transcript_29668/g.71299 Transcript_29668/m.71299 type:complete len:293 (+) Transcript_29668:91-969(+)